MKNSLLQTEKRNITIGSRRTSLQLEVYVWENAQTVANRASIPLADMLEAIWAQKGDLGMAQAVRLVIMVFFKNYADLNEEDKLPATSPQSQPVIINKTVQAGEAVLDDPHLLDVKAKICYQRALANLEELAG